MSLMERAHTATAMPTGLASRVFADPLPELRQRVESFVSATDIARMMRRSEAQARNEIRLVCQRVLREAPWLARSERQAAELVERYLDTVFGFGPLEELLADESVTEIMVNGSGALFCERDGVIEWVGAPFSNDEQVRALIDRIVSPLGRRIDESSPMVNARMKQGHRVNAIIPPLALDGPILTIRKFRARVYSLDELQAMGSMDSSMNTLLRWAVLKRCNLAVSGGTGSGKTTLLNALSCVIPHHERIITIEDSAELRFLEHPHVLRLEARPRNAEGKGQVTIRELVVNSLRMRPDRIVVGECRAAEALDMLQAMNTGHDGSLTTLHANSPAEAVVRLSTMVRYAAELPVDVIEAQIAMAIDMVVQTARNSSGKRYISHIVGYSYNPRKRECVIEPFYEYDILANRGIWHSYPAWVENLPLLGVASQREVDLWKQQLCL